MTQKDSPGSHIGRKHSLEKMALSAWTSFSHLGQLQYLFGAHMVNYSLGENLQLCNLLARKEKWKTICFKKAQWVAGLLEWSPRCLVTMTERALYQMAWQPVPSCHGRPSVYAGHWHSTGFLWALLLWLCLSTTWHSSPSPHFPHKQRARG